MSEHVYDSDDIHWIKNCPACQEYFASLSEQERQQQAEAGKVGLPVSS